MTQHTPQAYRHTSGTIAYINKPYNNWVEIAPVLDALKGNYNVSIVYKHRYEDDRMMLWYWFEHHRHFPITITELPEGWEPVEEMLKRLAE